MNTGEFVVFFVCFLKKAHTQQVTGKVSFWLIFLPTHHSTDVHQTDLHPFNPKLTTRNSLNLNGFLVGYFLEAKNLKLPSS